MKTVCITGASSGIGKQLARDYLEQGWQVYACGRNPKRLGELSGTSQCVPLTFSVDNRDEVQKAASRIATLDLLILNAGVCEYIDRVIPLDSELFKRVFDTNLMGTVYCLEAMLGKIRPGGQLAVISSIASVLPFGRAEAYGASKAATSYLVRSLALDLRSQAIDVSLISPGFVKTPLTDNNDFAMPMLISVDCASRKILEGIAKRKKHIAPPRAFTLMLQLLSILPYTVQHWLGTKIANR